MTDPWARLGGSVEALVADRYLDALLAAGDRRAADVPADAALDPELRATARALRGALVRVHPSFRFEERLAARLAAIAAGGERARDLGVVAIVSGRPDAVTDDIDGDPRDDRPIRLPAAIAAVRRPWVVGGAITSAALSIAGVAFVAWRASRARAAASGLAHGATGGPA